MLTLLTLSAAFAAPFHRDSQGVGEAVSGLLPAFQACLAEAEPGGAAVIRLRFTIDESGAPSPVEVLPAEADGALADCLRGPVSSLRFNDPPLPTDRFWNQLCSVRRGPPPL